MKTPKTRHSKPTRDPVTIDLSADPIRESDAASTVEPTGQTPNESIEPADSAAAHAESTEGDFPGPHRTVAQAEAEAAAKYTPDQPADRDNSEQFLGSEWPPQPQGRSEGTTASHAFGRADSAATSSVAPPAQRNGSTLMAGIAGGAVVLATAILLGLAGLLPGGSGSPQDVSALESQLSALRGEVDAIKAAPGGDTATLTKTVSDQQARLDQLASAVEQAQAEIETLRNGSVPAGGDVEARLAEVERIVSTLEAGAPAGGSSADLAGITGRITAAEAELSSINETLSASLGRLSSLESTVATLSAQLEAQKDQPKIALALTATALKGALDRGGPFAGEVETFAAIASDAPELPRLREIAVSGVATRAQIAAAGDDAAKAMIAAGRVVDENAGWFDRLWSSAETLVTVRPIGAVEGTGVPETVARMEQAANDGDYAKALVEYDSLPATSKAAGADYAGMIRLRQEAEQLVDRLLADALKAA